MAESERIRQLSGLPTEFWSVFYTGANDLVIVMTTSNQSTGQPLENEAREYSRQVSELLKQHGYENVVLLEFTNLTDDNVGRVREELAAAGGGAAAFCLGTSELRVAIVAPVADFNAFAAKLKLGTITQRDEQRRLLRISANPGGGNSDVVEMMKKMREAHADSLRRNSSETNERSHRAPRNSVPTPIPERKRDELDPNDPQYYEKLAEQMVSDDFWKRDKAVKALLRAEPSEVKSSETRQKNCPRLQTNGARQARPRARQGRARAGTLGWQVQRSHPARHSERGTLLCRG